MLVNCKICGKPFDKRSKSECCSPKCRAEHKRQYDLVHKKNRPVKPRKDYINTIIDAADEYNRTHGTSLSYGKYLEMLYANSHRMERKS